MDPPLVAVPLHAAEASALPPLVPDAGPFFFHRASLRGRGWELRG
jgi:hypothetical protein